MSVFIVILPERNSEVVTRLNDKYSKFHEVTPTVFLLVSNNLSTQVADELGLKGENRISPRGGIVFKLQDIYAGRADPSVWEWLKSEEDNF